MKKYAHTAKGRGVAIVQSAGFTSLLPDLLAMIAATDLAKNFEEPPDDVVVGWTKLNGYMTKGFINATTGASDAHGPVYDPYILAPHTPHMARIDTGNVEWDIKDGDYLHMKLEQYSGAEHDCPVIRRSMHAKFPRKGISVREAKSESLNRQLQIFTLDKHNLALTESGLPKWLQTGSFAGKAVAMHGHGRYVRNISHVSVTGRGDPAVTGSSTVATELALGLASRGILEQGKGGFLTPALALGDHSILKKRLQAIHNGRFIQFYYDPRKVGSGQTTGKNHSPSLHEPD